jgi:3-phosphoshikimate 1-carboxyvinyltransferase
MRFLTALVCLGYGRYRIDGVTRMRERPLRDLMDALEQLGARFRNQSEDGFPPITVYARGLQGGETRINGNISSQFLTAVLMVSPLAQSQVTIFVHEGLVSQPFVNMTLRMMADFGVKVDSDGETYFRVPQTRWYHCDKFKIEPDATSASYFYAAAAITLGDVVTPTLKFTSYQGDARFLDMLALMGCRAGVTPVGACLSGARLAGIDVDMNHVPDTAMTLAAVACFADSPTTIRNVAHIRHKECDRIAAMTTELRKLGVEVEEHPDGWTITPRPMHGAELETYNDHRIAMSLALIGLKVPGVVIKNPACVAKTYPGFWEDFEKLYQ